MLSESERRRLNEIEVLLAGDDPKFVAGFSDARSGWLATRRRPIAIGLAVFGGILTVVALVTTTIVLAVVGICVVGLAGGVWTWRSRVTEPPAE